MVSSVTEIPTDAPGNIILSAQLYAAPGQADRLQDIVSKIQEHSNSDAEPDCLEYRTVRSFVGEGVVKFVVWEVYKNTAALKTHSESKAFAGLVAGILRGDLLERPPIAEYFYEF